MARKKISIYDANRLSGAEQKPVVRVNIESGLLEGVNADGSIAWREKPGGNTLKALSKAGKDDGHRLNARVFVLYDENGNEVQLAYNPALLAAHKRVWPYSEPIGLEIARRVAEGDSLRKIAQDPDMPPVYILGKWKLEAPGFKALLDEAKKLRAEMFHDEIMEVKDKVTEATAKKYGMKFAALKHLAAIGDSEQYGTKTKIVGDANAPLSFVFHTGIQRGNPQPALEENTAIPAEGKTLEHEDQRTEDNRDGLPAEEAPSGPTRGAETL